MCQMSVAAVLDNCAMPISLILVRWQVKRVLENHKIRLEHGWFAVRNRTGNSREKSASLSEIRNFEAQLFRQPCWTGIDEQCWGIKTLEASLSNVFSRKLRSEFPQLRLELNTKLEKQRLELHDLGPPRATLTQQREHLRKTVDKFSEVALKCTDGSHDFEQDKLPLDQRRSAIWLHFQNALQAFLSATVQQGYRLSFLPKAGEPLTPQNRRQIDAADSGCILGWIASEYKSFQTPDMFPGPNRQLVQHLWKMLIAGWEDIAQNFISEVMKRVKAMVAFCLDQCPGEAGMRSKLQEHVENATLNVSTSIAVAAIAHSNREKDFMSINAARQKSVQQAIANARRSRINNCCPDLDQQPSSRFNSNEPLHVLVSEPYWTVLEIHDFLCIYGKVAQEHFIADVQNMALDLIRGGWSPIQTMSAEWVEALSDDAVNYFAAESRQNQRKRAALLEEIRQLAEALEFADSNVPVMRSSTVPVQASSLVPETQTPSVNSAGAAGVSPSRRTVASPRHAARVRMPPFSNPAPPASTITA